MKTAFWAGALGIAVLWPARFAGPFDGAPLDTPLEAVALGLFLPVIAWFHPPLLRLRSARTIIVLLLAWKVATNVVTIQEGWCVRFTTAAPVFVEDTRVPHSWDLRADWRAQVPRCSAVMTHGYSIIERFPAWFYNLPPADLHKPGVLAERPPFVTTELDVTGYLHVDQAGVLAVEIDDGVRLNAALDGIAIDAVNGVQVEPGTHQIEIDGELTGSHWRLMPKWNGRPLWSSATATMSSPANLDLALRPWGRWVPVVLIGALFLIAFVTFIRIAGRALWAPGVAAAVAAAAALSGRAAAMRLMAISLAYAVWLPIPRRLQNTTGMLLLVGLPFLTLFAVIGIPQAGLFTWYSIGDDWWMFQRYSYRIYLQGYWLEGGEPTFWFQPFYRWVAGALHLVFGDSSVGELFWDAVCTLIGALFAFQITRALAGYRWGAAAAVMTLALMLLGPPWYLFGRGLSEITSMGFLYGAALFAMRGRRGHLPSIVAAGVFGVLSFYTRLNSLPMVLALAAFAWSASLPVSALYQPAVLIKRASRPVLFGLVSAAVLGVLLFTARTYYYTGVANMFEGTQAGHLLVWQPAQDGSIAGNVIGSVLMVLTMGDSARLDPRALPIVVGVLAALGGIARVGRLRCLPLAPVALCLAGVAGTLLARGSAYPGRFSVPMIPITVALSTMTIALLINKVKPSRCVSGTARHE